MKKMRSVIELVDVMKVSDEESILLTEAESYEQAADQLLAMGPKLVAITLGEQGVLMATKSRKEIIKAFQIHAVDTTGAKNTGNKTYRNLHKIQAGANIESCPAYIFVKNRGVFIAPILSYTFIISA